MGNKINPIYYRLSIKKNWLNRWTEKKNYQEKLLYTFKINTLILKNIKNTLITKIYTEHFTNYIIITIFSNIPGTIIGKNGARLLSLKSIIQPYIPKKEIFIIVKQTLIKDAIIHNFLNTLEKHLIQQTNYKPIINLLIKTLIKKYNILGIKIIISGRINGAEIAKKEIYKTSHLSLSNITSNIKMYKKHSKTKYGTIGILITIIENNND